MKKVFKNLIVAAVLISCCAVLSAQNKDEHALPNVDAKYIGTYIPVDFENYIKANKDFYGAFSLGYPVHHDVLYLGKNICYSDAHFHDGYAVTAEDFKNYRFVTNANGTFCIDNNGNSYRQITNPENAEKFYDYPAYCEYVMKLMFNPKYMDGIEINGNKVTLDGVEYTFNPDTMFFSVKDVAMWLHSDSTGWRVLVKNGSDGELHEAFRNDEDFREWQPKADIVKKYSFLFMKDKN